MHSIDRGEVEHFSTLSDKWWDESGPLWTLHRLNPLRLTYIRDHLVRHFGERALKKLKVLDVGCGAGILCEPLARMGMDVTGLDVVEENIKAAKTHAQAQGLDITYYCQPVEEHLEENAEKYDVVLAMEVIEHVRSPDVFVQNLAKTAKPNGIVLGSTINRTIPSFLKAILMGEYILKLIPKGTHEWYKFITPDEFSAFLLQAKLKTIETLGFDFSPFSKEFRFSANKKTNYFIAATKDKK